MMTRKFKLGAPPTLLTSTGAVPADLSQPKIELPNWLPKITSEAPLFMDNYLSAGRSGLTRRVHQLEKHPANPLAPPAAGKPR
jgi:hypothetical protein